MTEILAEVYRNKTVESYHSGSIVVSDKDGNVLYYCGDPDHLTYTRSSAKPFQFLQVYETGATKHFGHSLKQMAIMLGSHNGSDEHVAVAKSNLELIGLDELYLKCGTHVPAEYTLKGYIPYEGQKFTPLNHNCSGKHSGQLALCVHIGDDPKNYIDPESKTQKLVKQAVSEAYNFDINKIQMGTDGCSLPNFAIPLKHTAFAFAKIVTKNTTSAIRREAYETIIQAMTQHPMMVSGNNRPDLAITIAGKGDVICKVGGEAIEGVGVISKGIGIGIKMADGNTRALWPVICETLRQLGVFGDTEIASLAKFSRPQLPNNREIIIGEILPVFKLKRG